MTKRPLSDIPTDELLADGITLPPRPSTAWHNWLVQESIYPGQTKVQATVLFEAYHAWCASNRQEPLTFSAWGKLMATRFKKMRRAAHICYYVSKSLNPSISPQVMSELASRLPK